MLSDDKKKKEYWICMYESFFISNPRASGFGGSEVDSCVRIIGQFDFGDLGDIFGDMFSKDWL